MLGHDRVCLAFTLLTTATLGCGSGANPEGSGGQGSSSSSTSVASSSSSAASSSSSSSSSSGIPGVHGPGIEKVCASRNVLAVSKLYFGDGDSGQWKSVGFNLDGLDSTAASTNLCKPADGAAPVVPYPDGNNGIDNSFGKNLLPQILAIDPTWVTDVNNSITEGLFTALLEMDCLPAKGDDPMFTTKLFAGETIGTPPKWDGTDKWPVEPDLLNNPKDPESSSLVFTNCSLSSGMFDGGKNGTIILTIPVTTQGQSTSLKLTLYAARLTMNLAADRKSATGGMIGGVLNTAEFVEQVKKVGYLLELCNNALLADLLTQVEQASDIMSDGTQDTTKTCDGISMGLGFDMMAAEIGDVGPPAPMGSACP
jgi:hypothetical protein